MIINITIEIPKISDRQTYIEWILDHVDDLLLGEAPGEADTGGMGGTTDDRYQFTLDENELVNDKCVKCEVKMDNTAYSDEEGSGHENTFAWRTVVFKVAIDRDPNKELGDFITEWAAIVRHLGDREFKYRDLEWNLIVVPDVAGDGIYY